MNTATTEVSNLNVQGVAVQPAHPDPAAENAEPAKAKTAASDFVDDEDEDSVSAEDVSNLEQSFGAGAGEGDSADGESEQDEGVSIEDLSDLDEEESGDGAVVEVFKKKCLNCKALVPWAEKTYKSCHHSNGNEFCPAATIKIQTRIPFEDIVPRFLAAEEQSDTTRLLKLYENLAKLAPWKQEAIHDALKRARAAKAA